MSGQTGGILQIPTSYNYQKETTGNYRNKSIDPSSFMHWHQNNMYMSTYTKFHNDKSAELKNSAIPGYSGYVPSVKTENLFGRGYSSIAKESFSNEKLGQNRTGLATTGYNLNKEALLDNSLHASSSKYGKSALQRAHPGWHEKWETTNRKSYQDPNNHLNPTFRETEKLLETMKPDSRRSGFAVNYSYLDGKGWKPDPVLMGDYNRTEYRDRFNPIKQYHRDTDILKERKLRRKQMNYPYL